MMRRLLPTVCLLAALLTVVVPAGSLASTAPDPSPAPATALETSDQASEIEAQRDSSLMFIENVGQWDDGARFQVRGAAGGTVWLAEGAIWLTILEPAERQDDRFPFDRDPDEPGASDEPRRGANIKLSFVGANPQPVLEPFDRVDTVVSYFLGNDPDGWRPDVPVWGGVRYVDLYPGVNLELRGEGGRVVPRLAARAGADLSAVRLRVEGAESVTLQGEKLRLRTAAGDALWPLLETEGARGGATVQPSSQRTFQVTSPFVRTRSNPELSIASPQSPADNPDDLLYSTFLGGSDGDSAGSIAVDVTGSAYVMGTTRSLDFPTTPDAFDTSFNGGSYDAFVAKLNPNGSALDYASFIGGSDNDGCGDIALDRSGAVYVSGETSSSDFPTTPDAFDTTFNTGYRGDGFVAKLNSSGSDLVYATFLGGTDIDEVMSIAVDESGHAYVAGSTHSSDFPTTPGAFDNSLSGSIDAFVVKMNPAGTDLTYATLLGGYSNDWGDGLAVDGTGSAYVTGSTQSADFPTTPGAFDTTYNTNQDAFVAKLDPSGSNLAYSTFLGGSGGEGAFSIAMDGSGAAYIAGVTDSSVFPTTPDAFDTTYNGAVDAFIAKLNSSGSALIYATFLGGSGDEYAFNDIAVDGNGMAYVLGDTSSSDFPTTPNAFDTSFNGGSYDAFVAKLDSSSSALIYATYLGGSDGDFCEVGDIAVDESGAAYVGGFTWSSDFPTTIGAFDTSRDGGSDAFVVKLAMEGKPVTTYSISGQVRDGGGDPIAGVTVSAEGGGSAVTGADGAYTITDIITGTYTLIPSLSGWTFEPSTRTVSVPPDATGQDFVGTPEQELYFISGYVRDLDGNPIEGITVSAGAIGSVTTGQTGSYMFSLPAGTYTIVASKPGWNITPFNRTVVIPPNAGEESFTATCSAAALGPIAEQIFYEIGYQHFCGNSFEELIRLPASDPPPPAGKPAFERFAELARGAKYEVDFVSMSWDNEKLPDDDGDVVSGDDSPMVLFLRGVRDLYDQVIDDPQSYPHGVKVRILTGLQYHHIPPHPDQRVYILEALDRLNVPYRPEDIPDEVDWELEVGAYRFSDTLPVVPVIGIHSHVKMLIVDGETAVVVGYNMEYHYLFEDGDDPDSSESNAGGTEHPWYDAGVQVSGPVVHECLGVFDGLWTRARVCQGYEDEDCSDESEADWPEHATAVQAIHAAGEATDVIFSLFRDHDTKTSDRAIETALKAAKEQVRIFQNRYYDGDAYDDDFWPYERGLMDAARRNVPVQLLLPNCHYQLQDCAYNYDSATMLKSQLAHEGLDVEIRMFSEPIHGKALVLDDSLLIVGSQNWDFTAFGDGYAGDPGPWQDLAEYNLAIDSEIAAADFTLWYTDVWKSSAVFVPTFTWPDVGQALESATQSVAVFLEEGIYPVSVDDDVVVTKPVSLVGAGPDETIIECVGDGITPLTLTGSSSSLSNLTIRNCDFGVSFVDVSSTSLEEILVHNVVFENNEAGGVSVEGLIPGSPVDFTIQNNTFVGGAAGLVIDLEETQVMTSTVRNNIFSGQSLAPIQIISAEDGHTEYSYNLFHDCGGEACATNWHAGNLGPLSSAHNNLFDLDPDFVDRAQGDYRLSAGSPAIDAGDPTIVHELVFDGDLDGVPRIDIGAFEAWTTRSIYLPLVSRAY